MCVCVCKSEIQDGYHHRTKLWHGMLWDNELIFFRNYIILIETKLYKNNRWMILLQDFHFLCQSEIQNGQHHRTLFSIRPCESFLSETTYFYEPKQCMNNQESDTGSSGPLVQQPCLYERHHLNVTFHPVRSQIFFKTPILSNFYFCDF